MEEINNRKPHDRIILDPFQMTRPFVEYQTTLMLLYIDVFSSWTRNLERAAKVMLPKDLPRI